MTNELNDIPDFNPEDLDDVEILLVLAERIDSIKTAVDDLHADVWAAMNKQSEKDGVDPDVPMNHVRGDTEPMTDDEINDLRNHALGMVEGDDEPQDDHA